jgi:hypothetical protein
MKLLEGAYPSSYTKTVRFEFFYCIEMDSRKRRTGLGTRLCPTDQELAGISA